jgi:hypothetical protein
MSQQYPPPPGDPYHQHQVSEHLTSGQGAPMPPGSGRERRPRRGRRALVVGGGVVALALVGGGVWAWSSFFSQGAQPAEALPASTLGYVAVDLDPPGEQKLEAVELLNRFPSFEDEVDLSTDDDIKKKIFEAAQAEGACEDVDYDDEIEPWLGDRAAVAWVGLGSAEPAPVMVVQIKDQDAAEDGIATLVECGEQAEGGEDELGGYAFSGDWVVLAETEEIAQDVVDAAGDEPLSEDGTYTDLVDAAGDPGVMTMYASPDAGDVLWDSMGPQMMGEMPMEDDELEQGMKDFPGLAGTLRFDDGSVQLEMASGQLPDDLGTAIGTDAADETISTLPATSSVALGFAFREGWGDELLEQLRPYVEDSSGMTLEDALAEAEAATGLTLPDDLETLTGESFALALDGEFDPEAVESEGPGSLPVGAKIQGDAEAIEEVLDKIRQAIGPEGAEFLQSSSDGDTVVVGPDAAYLEKLAEDGGLGDEESFEGVVDEAEDASAIYYVDFDAPWLTDLVESFGDEEVSRNLEPLGALGFSTWVDDEQGHLLIELSTQD